MAIKPIEILIKAKDEFSNVLGGVQGKVAAIATAIAGFFTISLFKAAVDSAAELEAQLSDVQAVSGATKDEMLLLRKAAEEAGASTKFTATEAAGALGNLTRAGLSANDAIAALPATLSLAQAGSIGLEESSEIMTKTLAGFGLEATNAARIADLLAMGANASNTSVTGLGEALSYAAPTASAMGISLESTLAIIGKFADGGIDAGRAGTALNAILSQFAEPASKFRTELAGMGITTSNFEEALVQLAGAGDRGQIAIRAVGTEAAPALQSLINQGVPALEALRQKLVESEGSAANFAKVLEDNLTGAGLNFASVWDGVKIAVGTPVLPVLKDAVNELAGALRSAVTDGTVAKFGEAIAKGFQAGLEWARNFLAEVDFKAIAQIAGEAADKVGAAFDVVASKAENAGNIVKLVWGAMSAGVNAVMASVYAVAAAFAGVASNIQSGIALILDGIAKITFGVVADSYKLAADSMRLSAEATWASTQALETKARQAFVAMSDGAQLARDGWSGLTSEMAASQPVAAASARALSDVAQQLQAVAEKNAAATKATEDKQAADENAKVAMAQLRAEYEKAVSTGNWQLAAEKIEAIGKAASKSKPELDLLAGALKQLGITSDTELREAADKARLLFEQVKATGGSTRELSESFKKMADAAVASGDAGQLAFAKSQAAAQGFEVTVDKAGNTIVRRMNEARDATSGAGNAADNAAGSYNRMGQSAEQAAASAKKLADINRRFGRPGENSTQEGSEKDFDPGRGSIYSRPGDDPRNGNGLTQAEFQRKEKLKGQGALDMSLQFNMLEKLKNNTLTAADVPLLKNVVAALNANQKTMDSISPGLNSLQGLASDRKWANAAMGFQQFINDTERAAPSAQRPTTGPATAPRNPASTAARPAEKSALDLERERANARESVGMSTLQRERATPATTYVSNITLPGAGTTRIGFSDANSQREAEALMRQILAARGSSS